MSLTKTNYLLIVLGCIVITLGFILMSGGGTEIQSYSTKELFSFRRITLAPFLTILGYMGCIIWRFKRAKLPSSSESTNTKADNSLKLDWFTQLF